MIWCGVQAPHPGVSKCLVILSTSTTRTKYVAVVWFVVRSILVVFFIPIKRCSVSPDSADMFLYFYIQKPYVLILYNLNSFFQDKFSLRSDTLLNVLHTLDICPFFSQYTQTLVLEGSLLSFEWYKLSCFGFLSGWKVLRLRSVYFLKASSVNSGKPHPCQLSSNLTKSDLIPGNLKRVILT